MLSVTQKLRRQLADNWKAILTCLAFTFLWGLAAHGYMFANNNLSHDSLREFFAADYVVEWKLSLGRFLWPVYVYLIRGRIAYPWLTGLLSLTYTGLAVFLVAKIFDIRSKPLLLLVSGIMTANITVIAVTGSYIEDLDCDMLALLCAVAAVYCWSRGGRGFLWGIVPMAASLGLYQSYLSAAVTLIMIACVLDLLGGASFREVFQKGLKGVAMLLCAGLLYFCVMRLTLAVFHVSISSGNSNSLDTALSYTAKDYLRYALDTWAVSLKQLFLPASAYPRVLVAAVHLLLIGSAVLIVLLRVFSRKMPLPEKLLTLLLLALMPFGMNIAHMLTAGQSHDLMYYALWLNYIFILLVLRWFVQDALPERRPLRQRLLAGAGALMAAVVLWGNVRLANEVYIIKDFEHTAALSYMTRIVDRIESYNGYVQGETPVALVGQPKNWDVLSPVPEWGHAYEVRGMWDGLALGGNTFHYYRYVLLNYAEIADLDTIEALSQDPEVMAMPAYPDPGSITIKDGVLVVKLG